jgi:hypothetical protein
MLRLILFIMLLAAIALALASVMVAIRSFAPPAPAPARRDTMPETFRRIAYVLLIVLMFGVTAGWLGAA